MIILPPHRSQAEQLLWFLNSLEGPAIPLRTLARYMDCPKNSVRRAAWELRTYGYDIYMWNHEVTLCPPAPSTRS